MPILASSLHGCLRKTLAVSISLYASLGAQSVLAQSGLALEEVVVTAQKRTESLQDVPIAVSVLSGDKLNSADLKNLQEMSQYVPNFYQVATPTSNVVYIRGIGSAPNAGFEQSVGTFFDGIYLGRARQTLAPMFDLSRVEVLKGPQSILFGKNTSAGAVSISSNRPDFESSARVSGLLGSENEHQLQGYVNGVLGDSVAARLSLYGADQDGWVENEYDGEDGPATTDYAARLGLVFEPTDNLSIFFKAQRSDREQDGAAYEIYQKSQTIDPLTGTLVPPHLTDIDARQNFKTNYGNSAPLGNNTTASEITIDNAMLQMDFAFGEHTLTSITGYSAYEFDSNADLDFTDSNLINSTGGQEDFVQWSQELRLVSPADSRFDYITGIYLQTANVDIAQPIGFQFSTLSPLAGALGADGFRHADYDQTADTASAFFQGNFSFNNDWRLKFGLRYSYEKKELDREVRITDFDQGPMNPVALSLIWQDRLNAVPYEVSPDRSEDDWSPMVALEWNANDDIMTYVSASKGFKGGGYDSTHSNGNDLGTLEFDPESAISYEIGSKMTLMGGRGNLNIAIFYTQFEDLQVSVFDGVAGFNVSNAAEATTQGVELDTRWLLSEALVVSGSLAWLDYQYDDYDGAPCNNPQLAQWIVDTGHSAGCVNDLSGETVNYAPKWTAALSGTYTAHLGDSLDMLFTLDANFRDDYFLAADLDPSTVQDAYWKINARIALTPPDGRWEVALIGKNLTDETTYSTGTSVPFGSSNSPTWNIPDFEGTYYGVVDRPRSVALQLSYNFY
ncbi:MAG: TonB-dependent receptor [Halioglobus sp.]